MITGVIKANIRPPRVRGLVVTDSRVILDQAGAERLIGKGDMLLLGPASSVPQPHPGLVGQRGRGPQGRRPLAAPGTRRRLRSAGCRARATASRRSGSAPATGDDDDLLVQAMELVVRSQLGSTSMLQRKLRVGFARAGRLMDLLEQRGVVGPSTGSKARDVLMAH